MIQTETLPFDLPKGLLWPACAFTHNGLFFGDYCVINTYPEIRAAPQGRKILAASPGERLIINAG
jgi:hypothetical protein